MSEPLTTVSFVQKRAGLSSADPDLIDDLIREASDELVAACSREFAKTIGHVERVRGYGSARLIVVEHLPVLSIASIVYQPGTLVTLIDAADYEIERPLSGFIRRINGSWRWTARNTSDITRDPLAGTEEYTYTVTYTGGFVTRVQEGEAEFTGESMTLPRDIERAILEYVVSGVRGQGDDGTVISEGLQSGRRTVKQASASDLNPDWPSAFKRVVRRYGR